MSTPVRPSNALSGPSVPAGDQGDPRALAASHRAAQALLAAVVTRDILSVWETLPGTDVRQAWPAIRNALLGLLETRYASSVFQSISYYDEARRLAGIFEARPGIVPPVFDVQFVSGVLDATGPYTLLGNIKQGMQLREAMDRAGVRIAGAAQKSVLDGGRAAIYALAKADPQAVGWARITRAKPCAFCAMLASRGAVYTTEKSARFLAHDHCMCTAAPFFRKGGAAKLISSSLSEQWQEVTKGLSGKEAFRAWRRYWDKK